MPRPTDSPAPAPRAKTDVVDVQLDGTVGKLRALRETRTAASTRQMLAWMPSPVRRSVERRRAAAAFGVAWVVQRPLLRGLQFGIAMAVAAAVVFGAWTAGLEHRSLAGSEAPIVVASLSPAQRADVAPTPVVPRLEDAGPPLADAAPASDVPFAAGAPAAADVATSTDSIVAEPVPVEPAPAIATPSPADDADDGTDDVATVDPPSLSAKLLAPPVEMPAPLDEPRAIQPAAVWLVERAPGFEQYSNGLRIDTSHTVDGEKRHYHVFTAEGGMSAETYDRPVGILFHTTESHLWPLDPAHNENLRDSSANLVGWIARDRVYHYLIDRFGRVYRAIDDGAKANHAGNAVWQHGDRIYLNLNHAFLGVSFETRWEGGRALPITQAQLVAGRNLTDWLRQRWDIPPEMCVTHGLTSVNPRAHLIGHHLDWARGFPFAAFGLPDQYAQRAPSVFLFGFGYDEHFLGVMGQPWDGVREAERALAEEAVKQGRGVDVVRKERRALYDRWRREQGEADDASRTVAAQATAKGG